MAGFDYFDERSPEFSHKDSINKMQSTFMQYMSELSYVIGVNCTKRIVSLNLRVLAWIPLHFLYQDQLQNTAFQEG